jgi:hypothetical protein
MVYSAREVYGYSLTYLGCIGAYFEMKTGSFNDTKLIGAVLFNLVLLSTVCGCGDLSRKNAKEQIAHRSIYRENISVQLFVGRFRVPVPVTPRNYEYDPCAFNEDYDLLWAEHEGLVKVEKQQDQVLVTLTDPNTYIIPDEAVPGEKKKCGLSLANWDIGKRKDLNITAIARDGNYATAYFEYNIDLTKAGVDYLS